MAQGFEQVIAYPEQVRQRTQEAFAIAKTSALALIKERIFDKGLDANLSEIKNVKRDNPGTGYSDKAYFALLKDFVNKGSVPNRFVSKTGKSVQLPKGYESFRQFSGRQTNFVDLNYSGVLFNSVLCEQTQEGFKVGIIGGRGGDSVSAVEKAEFADSRNGSKVFAAAQREVDQINRIIFNRIFPN